MQIIRGIPQGSEEWLKLKNGLASASRFDDAMARGRGKDEEFGKAFFNYALDLAIECISGQPTAFNKTIPVIRGNNFEPIAAMRYSMEEGMEIEEITGILVNENVWVSPDRLVGDKGLVEIKCPNTSTHVKYILGEEVPDLYKAQTQGQLWGSEREWNDFVSYDDRWIKDYFKVRVYRDEPFIKNLENRLVLLIEKRDELIYKLKNYKPCHTTFLTT